ncbi:hypothetical protein ACWCPS_35940 [Streptomyces mauvecolor]
MWDTVIAVAGTLLGVLITHLLQYRATDRREYRQAILDVAAAMSEDLNRMRRLQETRWKARGLPVDRYTLAREAALEVRSAAGSRIFRLKALVTDPGVLALAHELTDLTFNLHDATDADDLNERYERARTVNDRFALAVGRLIH